MGKRNAGLWVLLTGFALAGFALALATLFYGPPGEIPLHFNSAWIADRWGTRQDYAAMMWATTGAGVTLGTAVMLLLPEPALRSGRLLALLIVIAPPALILAVAVAICFGGQ